MKGKAIILDLDDTIFRTKSMDSKIFVPFFDDLLTRLKPTHDQLTISRILSDLWILPIHVIAERYNIPKETIVESAILLNNLRFELNISTYSDYDKVRSYSLPKFLVTTGITNLQKAKISALKIENDFIKTVINDTLVESKTKKEIFEELIQEFDLTPERTYVIGDNPDSEIADGNTLGMVTIQIVRENITKGNNAVHYIESFDELDKIIRND
jgi:putative hydrolase of the HAD superfamily